MLKTAILLILALMAFAGNSILNREALASGAIDWASFTAIRIASGALCLTLLYALSQRRAPALFGQTGWASWAMPLALFVYAAAFSWAYLDLSAATGALILFTLVQITMQSVAILTGARPGLLQWLGLAIAMAGLAYLLSPGLAAPPVPAASMMALSGVAWGIYSWLGRGSADPLAITARNFLMALPLVLVMMALFAATSAPYITPYGAVLSILSGAVTSGIGYALWYSVLPHISTSNAGVAQLTVPVIAAIGGVAVLGEGLTSQLVFGGALILCGIALTILAPKLASKTASNG